MRFEAIYLLLTVFVGEGFGALLGECVVGIVAVGSVDRIGELAALGFVLDASGLRTGDQIHLYVLLLG